MATLTVIAAWGPVQLTGSAASLYTAPTSGKTQLGKCTFTNTDTSARTITVYLVRSGGSASLANCVISAQVVQPGECYVSPELYGVVLGAGDSVQGFASTASVITTVGSGYTL